MIALRTPRQKTDLYGATPLTAAEAFTGSPRARIGAHNDCFLASITDDAATQTGRSPPAVASSVPSTR